MYRTLTELTQQTVQLHIIEELTENCYFTLLSEDRHGYFIKAGEVICGLQLFCSQGISVKKVYYI